MKPSQLLTVTLALAPLASAWPGWLPEADSLVVRQDDNGGGGWGNHGRENDTGRNGRGPFG